MKKEQNPVLYMAQIGVIIAAVFISLLRLSVYWVDGYESNIESWFEGQGIHVSIERIALKIDGLTPEVSINGLTIKDDNNQDLLTFNNVNFYFNVMQSLLQQQIIVDKGNFYISKATLDTSIFNQSSDDKSIGLAPSLWHSLMGIKRLSFKIDQLDIVNKQQNYSLYQSSFSLKGDGSQKLLQLRSSLRQQKTSMLTAQFNIDVSTLLPNALADSLLKGDGYIALNASNLSTIPLLNNIALKGDLKLSTWLEFEGLNVSAVSSVEAQKVIYNINTKSHQLDIDSTVATSLNNGKLSIEVVNNTLNIDKLDLKTLKLSAQSTLIDGEFNNNLLLIESLSVKDITKLASSVTELKPINKLAKSLKPQGFINELLVQVPKLEQLEQFQVSMKANDLQWQAKGEIPAVKKLSLDMVANKQHFNAQVNSDSLNVLLAEHYTQPFSVNSLKAIVNGQINADGVLLDIPKIAIRQNKAKLDGRASLNLQHNASPHLFLRLQVQNANIKTVTPFLPQILMDEDVIHWVKQSVKKANVKTGDVLYAGRLENDVNFDVKKNGIFDATLNLENIDLSYDSEWPSLQSKQVQLTFKNYQLKASSSLSKSQGIDAKQVVFYIPNLDDPQAELSVNVNDTLTKQWAFLKASPIQEDIPLFADVSELQGKVKTAVTASFPLINAKMSDVKFNVDLTTKNAGFAINTLDVSLSDINTDINITQDGLRVKAAPAKWFDQVVSLEASTKENEQIHLKMYGDNIEISSLLHALPNEVNKHLSGKSAWEVNVLINQNADDKLTPIVNINAHSGLKGIAIYLPAPFTLAKDDTNYIKASIDIYKNLDLQVELSMAHGFDAIVKFKSDDRDGYDLIAGHINFGDQTESKPKQIAQGLSISGQITELNLDHWSAYLDSTETVSASNSLPLLNSIDLSIGQLDIKGIAANNTKINLKKVEAGLNGTLQSSVAKGEFFIPVGQNPATPIDINMDFVDINIKEGMSKREERVYSTNQIPTLKFRSKQLKVNGKQFTNAKIDIESHNKNQFKLKTLSLAHNKVTLNAVGAWDYNKEIDEHESQLKVTIKGKQFGQALAELGLGEGIENGKVDISSKFTWPDAFWSLDLAEVSGSLRLKLQDGYLMDVDPGGGRFVGLLSLSALPRRLTLDFSDFFSKGLEFDKITGDFLIYDGSMWTKNLNMKGAVTDVKISGRTGLKTKDYDQLITVIPQVRDALPVLGSLVSGSSVGWALLLIQRIFKDPIDESVSIKYKVTGHWDDPKIDVIEKPKLKEIDEDDDEEY